MILGVTMNGVAEGVKLATNVALQFNALASVLLFDSFGETK
jgi:hypothetical protein